MFFFRIGVLEVHAALIYRSCQKSIQIVKDLAGVKANYGGKTIPYLPFQEQKFGSTVTYRKLHGHIQRVRSFSVSSAFAVT